MTALLLVDIQNDFLPGGSLAVRDGNDILPIVNQLLELPFDIIVATKDWHPAHHGSFASVHGKKPGEKIMLAGLEQILWPDHCVQNTPGAEFSKGWNSHKVHKVFHKGAEPLVDSYSTFFDNDHHSSTGLGEFLKSHQVKEIYIAGLTLEYCVKYSVLDAAKFGFTIYVIIDACRPVNLKEGDDQRALEEICRSGAHVISSKDCYARFHKKK